MACTALSIFGCGGIGFPYILTQFVGFFIFIAAVQAELTQPPFDMPVAESEIVSGYQVEYTGFRFLIFFFAEFATAFAFAAIAAVLFLVRWCDSVLFPCGKRSSPVSADRRQLRVERTASPRAARLAAHRSVGGASRPVRDAGADVLRPLRCGQVAVDDPARSSDQVVVAQ